MARHFVIEPGMRIGRLTVMSATEKKHRGKRLWLCQCDCGQTKEMMSIILSRPGGHCCSTSCNSKLPPGEANFNTLFRVYRNMARRRGNSFELSKSEFRSLTKRDCFYCASTPSQVYLGKNSNGPYLYNGIDRLDNDRGYSVDNCVPCCGICNVMKNALSIEQFTSHIAKIAYRIEVISGVLTATDLTD